MLKIVSLSCDETGIGVEVAGLTAGIDGAKDDGVMRIDSLDMARDNRGLDCEPRIDDTKACCAGGADPWGTGVVLGWRVGKMSSSERTGG